MFYVTVKYEITTLLSSHDNWRNHNTFKWTTRRSVSIAYQHQLNTSRDINWSLIKTCLFTHTVSTFHFSRKMAQNDNLPKRTCWYWGDIPQVLCFITLTLKPLSMNVYYMLGAMLGSKEYQVKECVAENQRWLSRNKPDKDRRSPLRRLSESG